MRSISRGHGSGLRRAQTAELLDGDRLRDELQIAVRHERKALDLPVLLQPMSELDELGVDGVDERLEDAVGHRLRRHPRAVCEREWRRQGDDPRPWEVE